MAFPLHPLALSECKREDAAEEGGREDSNAPFRGNSRQDADADDECGRGDDQLDRPTLNEPEHSEPGGCQLRVRFQPRAAAAVRIRSTVAR